MVLESLMLLMALATPPQAPKLRLAPAPLLALAAADRLSAAATAPSAIGQRERTGARSLARCDGALVSNWRGTAATQPAALCKTQQLLVHQAGRLGRRDRLRPRRPCRLRQRREGAAVAALLLRRYYIDFKRHTAREIASRWAPPQCGGTVAPGYPRVSRVLARAANVARMLPQRPIPMGAAPARPKIADLAPHGIFNTVRARWLATHLPGGADDHGVSRRPGATRGGAGGRRAAGRLCAGDTTRINNYAVHIAEGAAADSGRRSAAVFRRRPADRQSRAGDDQHGGGGDRPAARASVAGGLRGGAVARGAGGIAARR